MGLTDAEFSKTFQFNLVRYHQFHLTDRTTEPLDTHFVGYLVSGTAEIRTRRRKLLLRAGDVFYMPKGLLYQSLWYPEAGEEVRFYSFGFSLFPTSVKSLGFPQVKSCSMYPESIIVGIFIFFIGSYHCK